MNVLWRLGCRLLLAMAMVCIGGQMVSAEPGHPSTIAIVLGQGNAAPSPLMEPALIEGLSKLPEVTLIEREEIRHVLDEMALSASGLVDPVRAIQFGKLLAAEAFVLVEKEAIDLQADSESESPSRPLGDPRNVAEAVRQYSPGHWLIRARLIETRTGIRLLDWFSENQETEEGRARLVGALIDELRSALGKLGVPHERRQYLGMLGLRSEEPGPTLDPTASALTVLVEYDLGRMPSVVVLEREQLQRLTAERDLTGIELDLRASTLLLEGGLRREGGPDRLVVTLRLIPLAGGDPEVVRVTAPVGDLAAARAATVQATAAALDAPAARAVPGDRLKEAEVFANRAEVLYSRAASSSAARPEEGRQALLLIEAALALDPTPKRHDRAGEMWGTLGMLGMPPSPLGVDEMWDTLGIRPPPLGVEALLCLRRAQEIDMAGIRAAWPPAASFLADWAARQRQRSLVDAWKREIFFRFDPSRQTTLVRPQQYSVPTAPYPLRLIRVEHYLEQLGPGAQDQRRLLLEINSLAKQILDAHVDFLRAGGVAERDLLLLRLQQTSVLAADPKDFLEMLRKNVSAFEPLLAGGDIDQEFYDAYAGAMWAQVWENLKPRMGPRASAPEGFRAAYEWLAEREDAGARLAGWYGISTLGGKDKTDAATQILDAAFGPRPAGRLFPSSVSTSAAIDALHDAGKWLDYLDAMFSAAENSGDTSAVMRSIDAAMRLTQRTSGPDGERVKGLLVRLSALLDSAADDPRFADSARINSQTLKGRLLSMDIAPPIPPLMFSSEARPGPWADYVIRPIPIGAGRPAGAELIAVCIDRSAEAAGGGPQFVLVWRSPADPASKNGTMRLVGCRMGVAGGPMEELGRCPQPEPINLTSIAAGGGAVFLATREHGLVMLGHGTGEVLDQSRGAPGSEIQSLAWLDGQLYLALEGTIARFDPDKRAFTILASSRSVEPRSELDGGESVYQISSLLADPKRGCLWITIDRSEHRLAGTWRYTPAADRFERVARSPTRRLTWGDGMLLSGGMGIYEKLDPDTLTVTSVARFFPHAFDIDSRLDLGGAGWVLVGNHVFAGPGWLYTGDGRRYYYDYTKLTRSSDGSYEEPSEDFGRTVLDRLGRGFVIVAYSLRRDQTPGLWYVEPRQAGQGPDGSPAQATALEADGRASVAILIGQGDQAHWPSFEPALSEGFSRLPDVKLVEREEIRQVLAGMMLDPPELLDPANAVQFGEFASADAFVLIEKEPDRLEGEPRQEPVYQGLAEQQTEIVAKQQRQPRSPLLRARLIETRTGLPLLDWVSADAQSQAGRAELIAGLRRGLAKLRLGDDRRQYLGIVGLRSEEPGATLDPLAPALTALVQYDLDRMSSVVILGREQLQRLSAGQELTAIEEKLRAAALLLEGELEPEGRPGRVSVALRLRPLDGGQPQPLRITPPANDLSTMRSAVVGAIRTALGAPGEQPQPGDRREEAEILADRARCLCSYAGDMEGYREAVPLVEAALALEPTLENHRLVACVGHLAAGFWGRRGPAAEQLPYLHRACQAELAAAELRLSQADRTAEETCVGLEAVGRLYDTGPHFSNPEFPPVYYALGSLAPDARDQRRLLLEIGATCQRRFAVLAQLWRRGGATELELSLLRLRYAWELATSPEEFSQMMQSCIADLDRQFDAGPIERASCAQYYHALASRFVMDLNWVLPDPRRPEIAPGRDPVIAALRPAYEWLSEHKDPMTRAAGHYGLFVAGDGPQKAESAVRMLDVMFRDTPAGQTWRWPACDWMIQSVTGGSEVSGRVSDYFKGLLAEAERDNDATELVRHPGLTAACMLAPDKAEQDELCRRVIALVDTGAFDARYVEQAKELRETCAQRSAVRLVATEPAAGAGPWADYVVRSIPVEAIRTEDMQLISVAVDHSDSARRDNGQLVLLYARGVNPQLAPRGWPPAQPARLPVIPPGARPATLRVCRMGLDGEDLREVGRCELSQPIGRASVAADDEMVAVATDRAGLVVIADGAAEVFDESKGAPAPNVRAMAWLDGQLYLAFRGTIARFDPRHKRFTVLASNKNVRQRSVLDGGPPYQVNSLVSDPQRHCLWLAIEHLPPPPMPERMGIWRYAPLTGTFELVVEGRVGRLSWSDGTMFYAASEPLAEDSVAQRRVYYWLDPDRLTTRSLEGYQIPRMDETLGSLFRGRNPGETAGWVLIGEHIIDSPGWLYTPDGGRQYRDLADAAGAAIQEGPTEQELRRKVIERIGRGLLVAECERPALWYVEPRRLRPDPDRQ